MSDPVAAIARAVLYEGYVLWPYRRSAVKNRRRWTFGGVHPRGWSEDGHPDDAWAMQAQLPVVGPDTGTLAIEIRFLHVVERRVARRTGAGLEEVDELTVDGERHLSWEEATERTVAFPELVLSELCGGSTIEVGIDGGEAVELLGDEGAIVRGWEPLAGEATVGAERLGDGAYRVAVRVTNDTPWPGGDRPAALRRTFVSTHAVLRASEGAELISVTDPPAELRDAAAACTNVGVWPVLVGEEGDRHTALASPIILGDYPQIAPESPGDLFDGGEIDELLILNVLTLSDEERREARDSDPRARELIDRCASLSREQLMGLHGTIRDLRPAGEA